jgi:RNA polymerase sigma-70 factor (ECF subfamily)
MLDGTDDDELAALAAEGDRAAFARLVERHYARIFALAWRLLRNRAEAEDLAQDVCIALGRRIGQYRAEARFSTWLYQVVLNAARDRWRRDRTRAAATAVFAEADALARAGAAAEAGAAAWLRDAIAGLAPELRETAVLVLDEGLGHAEAARILGIAESTVSWRMMELRRRLRMLAEAAGGPE